MQLPTTVLAVSILTLGLTNPAPGDWSSDASVNTEIATVNGDQVQVKLAAGTGGDWYVSWFDQRNGGYDVYMQRLDANGNAQWTEDGILVADRSFSSTQDYGLATAAGGGAIVTFRDDRGTGTQIGVIKVDQDGATVFDVQVTDTTAFVAAPDVAETSDGAVAVAWTEDSSVKAQRLDGAGVPQWTEPVEISDTLALSLAAVEPGDAGSAIVSIVRGGFMDAKHLWAQKLDTDGGPLWGAAPLALFSSGSLQFGNFPEFTSDGSGGAAFAWYQVSPLQCYVQHVNAVGVAQFASGGVAVSTAAGVRTAPSVDYVASDGSVVVAWVEQNGAQSMHGVFAQRVDAAGQRAWGASGVEIVPVSGTERGNVRAAASAGGAIVMWDEGPSFGDESINATRLDAAGSEMWGPVTVSSAASSVSRLAMRGDGDGAVAMWTDDRSDGGDIYGQNVNGDGTLGVSEVPGDVNGDGVVDVEDLLAVLAEWGRCPGCDADLDGNGVVDVKDLLAVLGGWS